MSSGSLSKSKMLELARGQGFQLAGIAPVDVGEADRERLKSWIERGFHGSMEWIDREGIDRSSALTVLPSARSVLMVALDYPAGELPSVSADAASIASYAQGPDYHIVMKSRLRELAAALQALAPGLEARPFVDTAPLNERAFARAAGLGWYGKNACLIAQGRGSFFFLGGLALSAEFEPDGPVSDHCGRCTRCLEACPTAAIVAPYQIDSRRCISYLTIEHRGAYPEELRESVGSHIFGCDICQAVCPWNRFAGEGADFQPFERFEAPITALFESALRSFKSFTRGTAMTRAGKKGLLRNLVTALANGGGEERKELIAPLLEHEDAGLREHAAWALRRLDSAELKEI